MPVDVGGIIASEVLELNGSWTIPNILACPTPAASDGNVLLPGLALENDQAFPRCSRSYSIMGQEDPFMPPSTRMMVVLEDRNAHHRSVKGGSG